MINPDLYSRYIRWNEPGDSIILSNDPDVSNEFAAEVLPKLFKHGNNASFVRQLNVSALFSPFSSFFFFFFPFFPFFLFSFRELCAC